MRALKARPPKAFASQARPLIVRTLQARPLFALALTVVLYSLIYRAVYCAGVDATDPAYDGNVTAVGRVTDKTLDEEGNIASFEIEMKTRKLRGCGVICYVNNTILKDSVVPYGAIVEVSGKRGDFKAADNPGEFDSKRYHENNGDEYYVNLSNISIISKNRFPIREWFHRIRSFFTKRVLEYCPLEGETINTLLFADKSGLDETRKELYKGSGIRHFLVLSGLHFSLAGGGIYVLFRKTGLKRYKCALISVVFVLMYGLLVGFTISVIRAAIMFLMRLLADALNRSYDILSALSLACVVTLLSNPLYIGDSAFLYSYVAVFSIAFFYTYLFREFEKRIYQRVYDRTSFRARAAKLKEALIVPFVIYFSLIGLSLRFQSYSNLLSIPLNLLLGVFSPVVIVFCALAWCGAMLKIRLIAGLFDFLLALILRMFDALSALIVKADPFKIVYRPSLLRIAVYVVTLVFVIYVFARHGNKSLSTVWLLSAALVCFSPSFARFNVTFLSVGQGDGAVIRIDRRHAVIVDCGSSSVQNVGDKVLVPFLMAEGITKIRDIYLSHSDADHINGVVAVLDDPNIRVGRVVLPDSGAGSVGDRNFGDGLEDFKEIIEACKKQGTDVSVIRAGAVVAYGDHRRGGSRKTAGKDRNSVRPAYITCLWPDPDRLVGDKNADSMVLWLSRGRFDVFFSGDATVETESRLILRPPGLASSDGTVEVYKCAHHGSSTSSSPAVMLDMLPAVTVISCGLNNRYGHPHAKTLETLALCGSRVYRTDHDGAVIVTPSKRHVSVRTHKGG